MSLVFSRYGRTTPILEKGGTHDGWKADALAAPAYCRHPTFGRIVSVSAWDISRQQWATLLFTGPTIFDLAYVPGSIRVPSPGNYINGDSGLAYLFNKVWRSYSQYPRGGPSVGIFVEWSTDLVSWTPVGSLPVAPGNYSGSSLNPNLSNGRLELWFAKTDASGIWVGDSPNGLDWTIYGETLPRPSWAPYDFSEPSHLFHDGLRHFLVDHSQTPGYRSIAGVHRTGDQDPWIFDGVALAPDPNIPWESISCFDACGFTDDLGDGFGDVEHLLYAGSDRHSSDDDTNSSIGLATLAGLQQSQGGPDRQAIADQMQTAIDLLTTARAALLA